MKLARMPDGSPEIFHTIQGEGRSIGVPSVFIRASLCNLHCQWCDTPYTWNWNDTEFKHELPGKFSRENEIIDRDTAQIVELVGKYRCPRFVFTGGEPLIQEKAWVELMIAIQEGYPSPHFEIETNGTLFPGSAFLKHIHQINVSPKLSNSGVELQKRYSPETLRALAETGKADFKFVVGNDEDLEELLKMQQEANLPSQRIFLMPQATAPDELERNQVRVSSMALEHGFRYSDRLHLRLYGAKRGV